jgi:putative ABC transport system permease protein
MPGSVSYILVRAQPGADADALAARVEQAVPGVTATSRAHFAASEQATVADMTSGIITIMNSAAFLIGLAVVAVSVYTATLSRRAEYGTLKAVGAGDRRLYGIVTLQALGSVAVALATAVLLTLALSVVMPAVQAVITVELVPWSVLKTSLVALAIAVLAALLPVRQVASLDPATVFRKKMA